MKLEPLLDRIVVKPVDTPNQSAGGIVLPSSADKSKQYGEVLSVGKGIPTESGEYRKLCVKKGQTVIFDPARAVEIKDGDDTLLIVHESQLLAVVKER